MPFTFSHPAIVLPLKKLKPGWFSVTGLISGSMAPDYAYFLRIDGGADYGHTLAGIFIFDLPVAFLAAVSYHFWIRNIFILHLPFSLDQKFAPLLDFSFRRYLARHWLLFAVSAVLGSISHILWDYLVSPQGWIYYLNPSFFNQEVFIAGQPIEVYILIEWIGSVLGLLLLGWVVLNQEESDLGKRNKSIRARLIYWGCILLLTLLISALTFCIEDTTPALGHAFIAGISGFLYAWVFVSVVLLALTRNPAAGSEKMPG